ncbi:MAG: phage terminase large subunit [Magnetococcales bacterium]|nr:phage terminase large subunit [Magnetococcales bacterium]
MADPLNKREFLARLASFGEACRRRIEAEVEGFDSDPAASAKRHKRATKDFGFFARTYFPHFVTSSGSVLHRYLFERLPGLDGGKGAHLAIAAPRGEAKSTLVSQIYVLWRVVTGRSRYVVIIMDAFDQAIMMLEAIKAELDSNQRLAMDFPGAFGQGGLWQEGAIVTRGGIKIQVFGSGKRMRGLRHGAHRPDLVICDDLENDENVQSRTQRDKLERWFKKAVLKLGPPDDSLHVVVIGTVLHHDSLLARLLRNPMWESRRFAAIIRWPDRMDLWEQWEGILTSAGEEEADRYYLANRPTLIAGAEVSWPSVRPLVQLMKIRARDGVDAFDSELQNSPMSENAAFAVLHFWRDAPPDLIYFGSVDPSMGKSGGRGDPSAILVGGLDRATGRLYVVEADIQRRSPERIIARVVELQTRYRCLVWIVETVQFQEFFKDELVRQSAAAGVPVPARGVKPSSDKNLRIGSLQPHIANGLILLRQEQTVLVEQLRHWGEPDAHDDGPDALHMLWTAAVVGQTDYTFHSTGRKRVSMSMGGFMAGRGVGGARGFR